MTETGGVQPATPADVLAAVIVYVPHLRGYFTNRLPVVGLSLQSLIRHKPLETMLVVFDNGSCEEVRNLLGAHMRRGEIDLLVRSRTNIGTPAALRLLLNMDLRPLIAYGDDDVFYYPGWLEEELEIWSAFPEAGMVSGVPTLDGADHAIGATLNAAEGQPEIVMRAEAHIPAEWEADWASSTGRNPEARAEESLRRPVAMLERRGVRAFVGATHFQYLGRTRELLSALPVQQTTSLMGNMRILDEALDRQGRMRLSTTRRVVRHMGNAVTDDLRREAAAMGLHVLPASRPPHLTRLETLLERNRWVHGKMWVAYRRIGRVLDGEAIAPDHVPEGRRGEAAQ